MLHVKLSDLVTSIDVTQEFIKHVSRREKMNKEDYE